MCLSHPACTNLWHLSFQLTWADFYFAGIIDYLNYLAKQDLTANHENLRKVVDNVIGQSAVQDWINKRPQTDI
jgi:glutathione S-transferase